jgi:hypothetical protein
MHYTIVRGEMAGRRKSANMYILPRSLQDLKFVEKAWCTNLCNRMQMWIEKDVLQIHEEKRFIIPIIKIW